MSSLTLSGVVLLLRITLALPVTVATLPIGSSGASAAVASGVAGSGAVAGAVGCEGSFCACASCVSSGGPAETVRRADRRAAGQQQEREGQLALTSGNSVHGEGRRRGPDFSAVSLNAG